MKLLTYIEKNNICAKRKVFLNLEDLIICIGHKNERNVHLLFFTVYSSDDYSLFFLG